MTVACVEIDSIHLCGTFIPSKNFGGQQRNRVKKEKEEQLIQLAKILPDNKELLGKIDATYAFPIIFELIQVPANAARLAKASDEIWRAWLDAQDLTIDGLSKAHQAVAAKQ